MGEGGQSENEEENQADQRADKTNEKFGDASVVFFGQDDVGSPTEVVAKHENIAA